MTTNEKVLVWLDSFDFMTYKKKENMLALFPNLSELLSRELVSLNSDKIRKIIGDEYYQIFMQEVGEDNVNKVVQNIENLGVKILTRLSSAYPENLANISTPPFVVYYKGNINLLDTDCFGIVGTRHLTSYGKMATEKFTQGLANAGFTIVSGLASGVDTVVHTKTLEVKGKTIAVLANGLDQIYPPSNTSLAERIIKEGGLIISESRPFRRAEAFLFPIRNRIIAGLSRGILVTEAQEKSGAMHTKNYALEYGKDVFAVPGSIFNVTSAGTNRMIINGQAKAVMDLDDVLCEYHLNPPKKASAPVENFSIEEQIVINLLSSGEKTFQELALRSNIETKKLNNILTMLTIRKVLTKMPGNIYYLNS